MNSKDLSDQDFTGIEGMMVDSLEKTPERESAIVGSVVNSFIVAKRIQKEAASTYLPESDWKDIFDIQREKYYQAIYKKEIEKVAEFLRNFFRNEGISGFWSGEKVFENFVKLQGKNSIRRASLMNTQLKTWQSWRPGIPIKELEAPRIGNPWGYVAEDSLLIEPVLEYNFQANYFKEILSEIENPLILEIGGGFGGLGYQILRNIPNVKYIGIDLPENLLIQSYYLTCAFPELKVMLYSENTGKLSLDKTLEYDIILLPNFMLPQIDSKLAHLIVNTRSLSEMTMETIIEYHKQIDRIGRLYFFHENIFKTRRDTLHGIPISKFPKLDNFVLLSRSESRWPRYQKDSPYPCQETLFIHKSVFHSKE